MLQVPLPGCVDGHLLPGPVPIIFPLCVCLCAQIPSFNKANSHVGLGPTLMTSF